MWLWYYDLLCQFLYLQVCNIAIVSKIAAENTCQVLQGIILGIIGEEKKNC